MDSAPLPKSVLVLGGGGMLAAAVARALRRQGVEFAALDRGDCDITDARQVERAIASCLPQVIFNCAAYTKVDAAERESELADRVNGAAVGSLANVASKHGVRLVHFSTDFVFDGGARRPYSPGDATGPLSAYGRSKLLGEQALMAAAPAGWLIVRTSWLFGYPGNCFPATMVRVAGATGQLRVVSDQVGRPTLTDDLAAAALELVSRGASGIYHVANAGETNWHDFAAAILRAFGLAASLDPIRTADWVSQHPDSAHRPRYSVLDTTATERKIGHALRPWQEALADYRMQAAAGA